MIFGSNCITEETAKGLLQECGIIRRMLVKSINTAKGRRKQLIIVLTSNPADPLGHGKTIPTYPNGMAKDFDTLTNWWNDCKIIDSKAKRLLILAPDKTEWDKISSQWDNVIHYPIETDNLSCELKFYYENLLEATGHILAPDIKPNL